MSTPALRTPSYFTPDEFIPLHKDVLQFLRREIEDVELALVMVSACLHDSDTGPLGAHQVMEMIITSLVAIREGMDEDGLVAPMAYDKVEIRAKNTNTARSVQ